MRGLPTPLTVEANDELSMALGAVRRGDSDEAEQAILEAMKHIKRYDKARKAAIYKLNTGEDRPDDETP